MKTVTVNKAFSEILESNDLINSYFGDSNITASYINDYRTDSVNDPDCILRQAGNEFFIALCAVLSNSKLEDTEKIFKHSYKFFNAYGNFYIYADNWSNACTNWYIIRASNNEEAINDLITRLEAHFIIENEDYKEDDLINDNGNHVKIDTLQLIGCIKTSE